MKRIFIICIISIILVFGIAFVQSVEAGGCSISEFTMNPTDPYTLGTHVKLHVVSNCGTVRFEINGQPKAEIGSSEQWETWKTEETGSGTHQVCAFARGDGGWENADKRCRTVYVEGGQAPPSGSTSGENVRCWVNSFIITPSSGPIGTNFNLASQGQCDGNMRAAKYTIDGKEFGEHSNNTYNTHWNSKNSFVGNHTICYLITAGDWNNDAAKSCVIIKVKQNGTASNDVIVGNQTTNNNPGQTEDSNPSLVDHPQGDPPSSTTSSSETLTCSGNLIDFDMYDTAKVTPGPANNLRKNHTLSASIIEQMPGNSTFSIVGGPACQDGHWWWKVNYQGKLGWTAQGDGKTNWIVKTFTQNTSTNTASSQENQLLNEQNFHFDDSKPITPQQSSSWLSGLIPQAMADDCDPRSPIDDKNANFTQCTEYVPTKRPDAYCWLGYNADANKWENFAESNGEKYGVYTSTKPKAGDIVVWEKGCDDVSFTAGHVAYVDSVNPDGTINITEANRKGDGKVFNTPIKTSVNTSCMTFIHEPYASTPTNKCLSTAKIRYVDNKDTLINSHWILRVNTSMANLKNGFEVYYLGENVTNDIGNLDSAGVGSDTYQDFWVSSLWAITHNMLDINNRSVYHWSVIYSCK